MIIGQATTLGTYLVTACTMSYVTPPGPLWGEWGVTPALPPSLMSDKSRWGFPRYLV